MWAGQGFYLEALGRYPAPQFIQVVGRIPPLVVVGPRPRVLSGWRPGSALSCQRPLAGPARGALHLSPGEPPSSQICLRL